MFAKDVGVLTYNDIHDLVFVRNEREGHRLDFKGGIGNPDKAKKEIAKDISAFANSSGGYLIFGIDKNYQVCGIEKTFQNRDIDEWLNQVLHSNIEPHLFYHDPKIITIPDSEKVIVVIHVPESNHKPHIVTEWNQYHIRLNDISKPANHQQIRDMFELSRNRKEVFSNFISQRNLEDENDPTFMLNKNTQRLYNESSEKLSRPNPLAVISFFPNYPLDQKISSPFEEFHRWLGTKEKGYYPERNHTIYHGRYDYDLKLDGVVLKSISKKHITSYFEILDNGYVEAGLSNSIFVEYTDEKNKPQKGFINLTQLIVYEMLLLGFVKELYKYLKNNDEVTLQLSLANVIDFMPGGLHTVYNTGWHSIPRNTQHNQFKLRTSFIPSSLDEPKILSIAKTHATQLCRAFGLSRDYVFVNEEVSLKEMNYFYL